MAIHRELEYDGGCADDLNSWAGKTDVCAPFCFAHHGNCTPHAGLVYWAANGLEKAQEGEGC